MIVTLRMGANDSTTGGRRATIMGSTSNNGEDAATSQRLIELVDLDRIRRINKKQKSSKNKNKKGNVCVERKKGEFKI